MNMNIFIIYFLGVSIIVPCSESAIPHFYLHRIANAMMKMRGPFDLNRRCVNDTACKKTENCLHEYCRDPCPGSCGINANCNVANHTLSCSCPRCFGGDPFEKCTPFRGLKNLICQFARFINTLGGV